MEFIEVVREFGNEIILAFGSIGIMTILLYTLKWFKPIFEGVVKPLFDLFRKETNEHLAPLEEKLDLFLEALAFDFETKASSPIINDYRKEKYLDYANKLIQLKNVDLVSKTIETSNLVEKTIDKGVSTVEDFLNRKG